MQTNKKYSGQLTLVLGCMFGGKTSYLINKYRRYTIGGKKCIMIKYQNDTRYDNNKVVTHDNITVDALKCKYLFELDKTVQKYDVICVDEVQFYKDAHIFCEKWANNGLIIIAGGLNGTFERKEFPIISKLIPKVENIIFLPAVCKETGDEASFTKRLIDDDREELIGGAELYAPVDRKTFHTSQKNKQRINQEIKIFTEFLDIYAENNILENASKINKKEILNKYVKDVTTNKNNQYISYEDYVN